MLPMHGADPLVGIRDVVACSDLVLRNLQITQSYHELSAALTAVYGSQNATWLAYATWASKTAGTFIRCDEVPALVKGYLGGATQVAADLAAFNARLATVHEAAHLPPATLSAAIERSVVDVASDIAQGNVLVFAEVAPVYAELLGSTSSGSAPGAARDALLSKLRPGPAPDGQDLLRLAFGHYFDAAEASDGRVRAQHLLCANIAAVYHEQTRLQPLLVSALTAPLTDGIVAEAKATISPLVPAEVHATLHAFVERELAPIGVRIEAEWREVLTRWVMTLDLPGLRLDLGKDVPPLADGADFPPDLRVLDVPALRDFVSKLDRTPDSLANSAAKDWGVLAERMAFIVDLFRSSQQRPSLFDPPFSQEQVAAIEAGRVPDGPL